MPIHELGHVDEHHTYIPSPEIFSGITAIMWAILSYLCSDALSNRNTLVYLTIIASDQIWEMSFFVAGSLQLFAVFKQWIPARFVAAAWLTFLYANMAQSYIAAAKMAIPTISFVVCLFLINFSCVGAYSLYTYWKCEPFITRIRGYFRNDGH